MRGTIVPLSTFAIAVALSAMLPSSRHLLRADGEATGCKVTAEIGGAAKAHTVTEGKDSIRDKGKEAVRKALDQGFKKLKADTSDEETKKKLDDTVDEVFTHPFDAVTVTLFSFGIDSIDKTATLWTVKGSFDASVVILLPKNATDLLKNHEDGHKLIAEKTVEYAKAKIKEAVEAAGCDEAAIQAAFDAAAQKAYDVHEAASKDYDDKTDHGKKLGAAGQLPQAAASFAAAAAQ